MQQNGRARVLTVGAYERDNFGDLLFLLVTERYLTDAQVFAAAPFEADMTALLDRKVRAYAPLLSTETFDAIWTVGGQVGGTDLRSAFRMSASPEAYREYEESTEERRTQMLQHAVGGATGASPYLPSLLAYPRNAGAVGVLNSVGLGGIKGVRPGRREELISLLHEQDLISVRDQPSSDYLASLGIEHRLVPDAVHAINRLRPVERDPGSDVAIVQISNAILDKLGHARVAAAIAGSTQLRRLRIRLLLAGAARGHDSIESYLRLVDMVRRRYPGIDIGILESRRPLDLVDHIAQARIVVGTSLHVRIVACTYDVPRVSLVRAKTTKYAETWDAAMPYGVTLQNLDRSIELALASADQLEVAERSAELSRRAHENLEDIAGQVTDLAGIRSSADRARRAEARSQRLAVMRTRDAGAPMARTAGAKRSRASRTPHGWRTARLPRTARRFVRRLRSAAKARSSF